MVLLSPFTCFRWLHSSIYMYSFCIHFTNAVPMVGNNVFRIEYNLIRDISCSALPGTVLFVSSCFECQYMCDAYFIYVWWADDSLLGLNKSPGGHSTCTLASDLCSNLRKKNMDPSPFSPVLCSVINRLLLDAFSFLFSSPFAFYIRGVTNAEKITPIIYALSNLTSFVFHIMNSSLNGKWWRAYCQR